MREIWKSGKVRRVVCLLLVFFLAAVAADHLWGSSIRWSESVELGSGSGSIEHSLRWVTLPGLPRLSQTVYWATILFLALGSSIVTYLHTPRQLRWIWKFNGVLVGTVLCGPIGAIIGAAVGHFVDRMAATRDRPSHEPVEVKAALRSAYSTAAFLADLARTDGPISVEEAELIHLIGYEVAGAIQPGILRDHVREVTVAALDRRESFRQIVQAAGMDVRLRYSLIRYAWRVAARDGSIAGDEVTWIYAVGRQMGCSDGEIARAAIPYYRPWRHDEEHRLAAGTLGIDPGARADEVRKHYRLLAQMYHPDRHPSASPELRKLAAKKFAAVSEAYKVLSESAPPTTLYGRTAEGEVVSAEQTHGIVRCFSCPQSCRLPERAHHPTARCPTCQALLLFDREMAEALSEQAPTPGHRTHA